SGRPARPVRRRENRRRGLAGTHLRSELGADAAGVGVTDLLEDPQRRRPGLAGGTGVARAEIDIPEAGEGPGLVVAVTQSAEQAASTLVADRGLRVVGQPVEGAAQAVPGAGLSFAQAQLLHQLQCLLAGRHGLLVLAESRVVPAEAVERECLPVP